MQVSRNFHHNSPPSAPFTGGQRNMLDLTRLPLKILSLYCIFLNLSIHRPVETNFLSSPLHDGRRYIAETSVPFNGSIYDYRLFSFSICIGTENSSNQLFYRYGFARFPFHSTDSNVYDKRRSMCIDVSYALNNVRHPRHFSYTEPER